MKTLVIDPKNINQSLVEQAVTKLSEGGIVSLPTETVYGLACRVDNQAAVNRLYELKARPKDKPFSLALGSVDEVFKSYFDVLPPFAYRLIEKFWPGPLTLVYYTRDDKKIGIRVPAQEITQRILQDLGLAVFLPSANLSGQKEAVTAKEVEDTFGSKIDLIVDGGPADLSTASTVLDLTQKPFKVLRDGSISEEDIAKVFIRKRILFVCTGNSCRSPMAQYLLEKYLRETKLYFEDRYEIISRGISAPEGLAASGAVVDILKSKEGVDIRDFSARRLTRQIVFSSDLIFTMEDRQADYILNSIPSASGRVFNLKKFLSPGSEQDIPDPISQPMPVYEKVYSLIKEAILELRDWV
ncbi:MAG: threonylcarbamoyl-AMP synthase [Candidatus Omnitrophica bacterium]|nr:threonylcarbamoyl-AMP synthase [Candidatus Omnitrophota bacterium]MBU2251291.1 threonylcarbamoyl-AMP synthase [Candidatus Omnitrophota bacterium]MBU2266178.1 threonylcarbamoyl-AMP synthase [Candidatus Omnitrophota bacterium]MBU2473981.1 threonylcarbamoyl-AMP synthase [Candidatus Omnitrophota bacterium]